MTDEQGGPVTARPDTTTCDVTVQQTTDVTGVTRRGMGRVTSVVAAMPFWSKGTPEQRRRVLDAVTEARRRADSYKQRVAAHPDLRERVRRLMAYQRYDQWGGYIPPAVDANGQLETGWARAELADVMTEVVARERAA